MECNEASARNCGIGDASRNVMSALLIHTYAGILKAFALVGFDQQALGVEAVTWWGKQGLWQRMMVYQWRQCDPLDCFLLKNNVLFLGVTKNTYNI